jgi:hypothetical protein
VSRRIWWGLAALALYVGGAAISFHAGLPARPVYDGNAPPAPYRWVDPPEELAEGNLQPQPTTAILEITRRGTQPRGVLTSDAQAQATLPEGAFEEARGARSVAFRLEPLDPDRQAPPPRGLQFDGNAYRTTAEYEPRGGQADLRTTMTVVLRYPRHATVLLRLDDDRWVRVRTTRIPAALSVVGQVEDLGTFVAAGPLTPSQGIPPAVIAWVSGGAAVLGAGVGLVVRRRIARERTRQREIAEKEARRSARKAAKAAREEAPKAKSKRPQPRKRKRR